MHKRSPLIDWLADVLVGWSRDRTWRHRPPTTPTYGEDCLSHSVSTKNEFNWSSLSFGHIVACELGLLLLNVLSVGAIFEAGISVVTRIYTVAHKKRNIRAWRRSSNQTVFETALTIAVKFARSTVCRPTGFLATPCSLARSHLSAIVNDATWPTRRRE